MITTRNKKPTKFDFKIKAKYHPVPKDEKEVLRPENNPKIVQRERMCFYLKELGYTQKLPSRIKYSFEFISKEGKSLMYIFGSHLMLLLFLVLIMERALLNGE